MISYANGAVITTEEFTAAQKASTIAAKAQSAAYKAVSVAANMLAMALITKGIELTANAIDRYVNRAKYAAEAMEEAQQKIDDAQNSLKSISDAISENRDRFLELSNGVDKFSNNMSLSKEDYEEYLDISNKFAELSPSLVSGYDEQGNALLNIGNNAEETSAKLDDILEKQKAVAEQTLIDNMDDVANGIYYEVENTKDSISDLKNELTSLEKQHKEVNIDLKNSDGLINFGDEDYSKYGKELEKALTSAGIEFENIAGLYDTSIQIISASPEQLSKAQSLYDSFLATENEYYQASENGLKKDIEEKEKSLNDSYSKMTANLQAWIKNNYDYQYLSDNFSDLVDKLIPEIDWNSLDEPPVTAYDYQNYVEKNILNPLMEIPSEHKQEIDEMFNKLLSFEDGDLNVLSFAKELEAKLNQYGIKIDITPIIKNEQEEKGKLTASIESISEGGSADFTTSSGRRVDADDYKKLTEYTRNFNTEQIELWNKSTLGANNATEAIKKYEDALQNTQNQASNETPISSYEDLATSAENTANSVSNLRTAISSVNDAFAEQAEDGSLSVDTMLSLVDAGYAAALQFDATTGACTINKEAMLGLVQAKIQNQIADLQLLQSNIATKLESDGLIASATAGDFIKLAEAKAAAATADQVKSINEYNNASAQIKALQNALKNINKIGTGSYSTKKKSTSGSGSKGSGNSGKSEADKAKEYLDAYMKYMEASLDASKITYQQYVDQVSKKLDDMYHQGKISAKDYFDYVKERLNQQLDIYKAALSAVTTLLDDTMDKIQDDIDSLNDKNDALNQQKDDYDSILSVVDDVYQKEIDKLNEQKDLLQDKIDALNDQNDALNLQYRKEQALYALRKAQEQRTKKIFNGTEFVYDTDKETIRDAQKNLQDIENEEIIKKLEDEQDALDKSIEELEKYRDLWAEIADAYKKNTNEMLAIQLWGKDYENLILQNRIQDINGFKDNYLRIQSQITDNEKEIKSLEEKKEIYQQLKDQWNSISSEYENQMNRQYAAQLLGANWEQDVLNGRLDVLNNFRNQYIAIQQAIADAAWQSAQAQIQAAQAAQSAQSGGSGSGGGGGVSNNTPTTTTVQNYHVVHLVSPGYKTNGEATSKISTYNGDGVYQYDDGKWYVYKKEKYSENAFDSTSSAKNYIKRELSPAGKFGVVKYAKGTNNAKSGLNLVSDGTGDELVIRNDNTAELVHGEQLYNFEGGETVIPAEETKEILKNQGNIEKLPNGGYKFSDGTTLTPVYTDIQEKLANYVMANPNYMSSLSNTVGKQYENMLKRAENISNVNNSNVDNSISIGEIHLHEVNDVDGFAKAIIRELPGKVNQALNKR